MFIFQVTTPIFPKRVSGRYLLSSGQLTSWFTQEEYKEKAIDILKNSIEMNAKQKKKNIALYKPKKKYSIKKDNVMINKLNNKKKVFQISKRGKKFKKNSQ
ncbi:hypothetical protein NQ314_014343 [Rhamnusium bicolor]|uniref:Uncharacterized protein n=1 Tax=Rhamnusium bicolor TaxID=1586634 RepID=A0AAV8X317_9CUCU|nr:hypothetical protein NQ314_014343 [Rhamnusium bicolor]